MIGYIDRINIRSIKGYFDLNYHLNKLNLLAQTVTMVLHLFTIDSKLDALYLKNGHFNLKQFPLLP